MKYVERERENPYLFLKIWMRNEAKWKFVWEWHGEFERVSGKEEDEQLEMFEGKLKRFKNWSILWKTRDFRYWIKLRASHQDQPLKHLKENFWKIF